MHPYPVNKHQLGVTGEESCECVLCLFCSQADRQIIMNDTPLHWACSWNETQRSTNSCGAIHLNVGRDTQGSGVVKKCCFNLKKLSNLAALKF